MTNDNNIRSVAIVLFKKVFGGSRSRAFTMETGGGIFMARFESQRSPRPRFAFRDNLLKRIAVSKISFESRFSFENMKKKWGNL